MWRPAVALALLCATSIACDVESQQEIPLPARDATRFEADVQPFVGPGCGSLDCHGDPGRPLRIYARFGLRMSAALRHEPVSAEELTANVAAFAALPVERLLGKPLAVDAGGLRHVGGELWQTADSPEYRCLAAWLDGLEDDAACTSAIAAAPY